MLSPAPLWIVAGKPARLGALKSAALRQNGEQVALICWEHPPAPTGSFARQPRSPRDWSD
jgi:hypothetical protein